MNPSGWLPGITDAALAHPKEYARGSIGTTEREGYLYTPFVTPSLISLLRLFGRLVLARSGTPDHSGGDVSSWTCYVRDYQEL